MRTIVVVVALLVAAFPLSSRAQSSESDGLNLAEAMFELEAQLDQMVVSGTKTEQRVTQAPAVITVIGAEEIQARGYTSLAEILRSVPGFYDVYDFTSHNVGIRGVNGGARAGGSIVKVMIDGQAVPFRTNTANFFGEELVPLAAIERVEIIRGPGSALYGANAFLGVVNVITRGAEGAKGARLIGQGGAFGAAPAGGAGVLLAAGGERGEVLVAAGGMVIDRSGLALPDSSPSPGRAAGQSSRSDFSRPRSFFAKASAGSDSSGRVELWGAVQNLDAGGEFQDWAPLSHGTRIALVNQTYRLSYRRELGPVAVRLSGSYFDSSPSAKERLDVGQDNSFLRRDTGVTGYELVAEAHAEPWSALGLTLGVDYQLEDHLLQSFDTVLTEDVRTADGTTLRAAGTVLPGDEKGRRRRFENLGAIAQAIVRLGEDFGVTAGARLDRHSVYGLHLSPRVGLVMAPLAAPYSLKLLFGTSFKAPSAEQLYTQPMKTRDIRGNDALSVQTARTGELAGSYRFDELGEVSANLYLTSVTGRVEYVQEGLYLSARNAVDELYAGGELDARFRLAQPLGARLGVGVSRLLSRSQKDEVFAGGPEVEQPLFPVFQAHLIVDYRLPWLQARLSPEISYVSERAASQSNALENVGAYALPGYVYAALSLSMPERKLLGDRGTSLALRATNVLGTHRAEPGFGGIDVPAPGRSLFLTLTQQL